VSRRLALATPHRLATSAGAAAFRDGGTALDAALAAAATLAVVAPQDCSIGGDAIALVGTPDGRLQVVNASGAAARAAAVSGDEMPIRGTDPITVPGVVAGWESLAAIGARLPWKRLLAPAIDYAEAGFDVAGPLARALARHGDLLRRDPGLRAVFAPHGRPLAAGATLRQPALARSLRALAEGGPAALYRGEVGARFVAGLRALGSRLTEADLADHASELTTPLRRAYAGVEIATAPPNSQGFVLLQLTGASEALGPPPDPLGPDLPLLAALARLTARDRDLHLADPSAGGAPQLERLLGREHLDALAAAAARAPDAPAPRVGRHGDGDTVAVVAMDHEGYAVSLIQSVYWAFGAGVLEPATGILCHNRGAGFSLRPGAANELRGGVRPPHTLMPVLTLRDGAVRGAHGTMGGAAQPQIHLQALLRLLRGASAAETVAAPRWIVDESGALLVEADAGVGPAGARTIPALDDTAGHLQLARRGADGALEAASDPRADEAGAIVVESR
jgi:gamma-glutamyltranspeptidase